MDPVPADSLMRPPYDGSVANLLDHAVEKFPDEIAVEHLGETRTYRELATRAERLAAGLRGRGFEPGDRVGVHLPNGVAFCETIWGCINAGVVASPLNPEYRRRELEYQLDHADADLVVTAAKGEPHAAPVAEDLGIEVVSTAADTAYTPYEDLLAADGERLRVERDDEDVLLQPYTSGTTGKPKGVLLTHRNFRVQIVRRISRYSASPFQGDAVVVFPMYHITGLLLMLSSTATGQPIHLIRPDEWDPELVLEKLDDHDVPAFGGVAAMFVDMLSAYDPDRFDLSSLRYALQGGDKLPESIHEEFEETLGVSVMEGYGLTETTAGTHRATGATLGDKLGSVGQPDGHTRSKIVDAEGNELPDGEQGELLVKGPQVMQGYYKDEQATEEAFTDQGFFRTGDIAERDRDNYYYIKSRKKDMILTGGYNVYPSEVEDALYDHPEIHEAAVFGIPHERRGETVAAAVSLVEGSDLTPDDVREYVLSELAAYKHPREVEIMDELPKTGSGKIRKVELRERFEERRDSEG